MGRVVRMAEAPNDRAGPAPQLVRHGVQVAHLQPRSGAAFPRYLMDHASSLRTMNATQAAMERSLSDPQVSTACTCRLRAVLPRHVRTPHNSTHCPSTRLYSVLPEQRNP